MEKLFKLFQKDKQYKKIVSDLSFGKDCHISGLWGSSATFLIACLSNDKSVSRKGLLLFVTPGIEDAEDALGDINTFLPERAMLFPASEGTAFDEICPDSSAYAQQLSILHQLLNNKANSKFSKIIITPIQALLQKVPSPEAIEKNILTIRIGEEHKQDTLLNWLMENGFERTGIVEFPGEFSIRGGIIDIFPYSFEKPYRIEFFGDEVDSIRIFNVETQASEKEVKECQILGIQNSTTSKSGTVANTLVNYLQNGSRIVFKEYEKIENKAKTIIDSMDPNAKELYFDNLIKSCKGFTKIYLSNLEFEREDSYSFNIKPSDQFDHDVNKSVKKVNEISLSHKRTFVFCNNPAEEQRFKELLSGLNTQLATPDNTINKTRKFAGKRTSSNQIIFTIAHLSHGFMFEDISTAFLTHHEIFHRYQLRRETRKREIHSRTIDSFLDLEEGDYVVHASHGIAKFLGIKMISDSNGAVKEGEFLVLEFDEGSKVYVPVTKIELVQKYICGSNRKPRLSKVGKQTWESKKKLVEDAVRDIASDLLSIHAIREAKQGIAYPKDTEWQRKFESEFIYQETDDQLQVTEDIKSDMESPKPMDRLVCGDVGYGKTELAIRAAFRSVMYGKQVAVLVPTTILAQQHFRTFTERMADYPININVLSRFKTRKEQKEILNDLQEGKIDIIIGTHRLVQKDVVFKDIGLVVIDEEQRFGVEHKEKLKKLRETVDVLTLTATPIPRTLHLSLLGIKDISSLNTPPHDRQSIKTRLLRFDSKVIKSAIINELNRDGQIYFVHNRVKNINGVADLIAKIVPEAKITVAHGQMPERILEKKMADFIDGKSDILVSTTIIESGLDIPNVNTIFINHADNFGLADLHQLRGRVGRYKYRAYTYLLLPKDRPVTPEAEKRLRAIMEFSELGAGFKIAMRDLEIRGAGNIIGIEQHGHIEAVGYEMFCRLLEIAIRKARNEPVSVYRDVNISLNLETYLPNDYVPDIKLKMEIYRKINRLTSISEVREMEKELVDRFGPIPNTVKNLLDESAVRISAQASKIRSLKRINGSFVLHIENLKEAETLFRNAKKLVKVIDSNEILLKLPGKKMSPEDSVNFLKNLLQS